MRFRSLILNQYPWLLALLAVGALSACNSDSAGSPATAAPSANIPTGSAAAPNAAAAATASKGASAGTSCHSGDSSKICLALKYISFTDPSNGAPVVTQSDASKDLQGINKVWSQCGIAFQIDEYAPEDPTKAGLTFHTANTADLDQIRKDYSDGSTMLVVTTGSWDRSGTLGSTSANAWTNMPGDGIYGAILEQPVGTYGNIVAHELGHYMSLPHVSDQSDLMNPVIYDSSQTLTADQCTQARNAVESDWKAMLR